MNFDRTQNFRILLAIWLLVLLAPLGLPAQTTPVRVADAVLDSPHPIFIVHSIDGFLSDTKRLFQDLKQWEEISTLLEAELKVDDVDRSAPIVVYASPLDLANYWGGKIRTQFQVTDFGKFEKNWGLNEQLGSNLNWQHYGLHDIPNRSEFADWIGQPHLIRSGDQLITGDNAEDLDKLIGLATIAQVMDARAVEILDRAGIAFINRNSAEDLKVTDHLPRHLTESEQLTLKRIESLLSQGVRTVGALKYQTRALEFCFRSQLVGDKTFSELVNFTRSPDYRADLGLVPERLVAAAAIRLDAFRDASLARLAPRLLFDVGRELPDFDFFEGPMLQILGELTGDSWNDLASARVAVYSARENESQQFNIVGVVDCRDTRRVLSELERLSLLTAPLHGESPQRAAEIQRLIQALASDDLNEAARAETRLTLAGPSIRSILETSKSTAGTGPLGIRIQRVLDRIQAANETPATDYAVADGKFWTYLRPGLELKRNTSEIESCPVHTITISPDPSKRPSEVAEAIRLMQRTFGNEWSVVSVVEVDQHLVFMVGTEPELLQTVIKNVKRNEGHLLEALPPMQLGSSSGILQLFVDPDRFNPRNELSGQHRLSLISLDIEEHSLEVKAITPVESLDSFLQLWW